MSLITWIMVGVICAIILACVIAMIVKAVKNKKQRALEKPREVSGVVEKDGVRYTQDQTIVDMEGNQNISYGKNDIVLVPRKKAVVSKQGPVKPGKYTVLSTAKDEKKFNIRVGLYVKEYKHGDEIVLAEGEEITPTSSTIILR